MIPEPTRQRSTRPPRWLLALIFALAAVNLLDVLATLNDAPQYAATTVPFPISLKIAYAGAWTIILASLAVDLIRRKAWSYRWVGPILSAYGIAGLLWQFVFAQSDYGRGRLPFQTAMTVIILLPVWALILRRGWLTNRVKELRHSDQPS